MREVVIKSSLILSCVLAMLFYAAPCFSKGEAQSPNLQGVTNISGISVDFSGIQNPKSYGFSWRKVKSIVEESLKENGIDTNVKKSSHPLWVNISGKSNTEGDFEYEVILSVGVETYVHIEKWDTMIPGILWEGYSKGKVTSAALASNEPTKNRAEIRDGVYHLVGDVASRLIADLKQANPK